MENKINTIQSDFSETRESLFRCHDLIEFIVPSQIDNDLHFQVICNGQPIALALLETAAIPRLADEKIVELLTLLNRSTYALKSIQVDAPYRNRGIGSMLLQEVLHWCRHNQVQRLIGELDGNIPLLRRWYHNNHIRVTANDQIDQIL
jgi:GNAT superfamily N-acetyltransferase